jgi:hypothetical protein
MLGFGPLVPWFGGRSKRKAELIKAVLGQGRLVVLITDEERPEQLRLI